MTQPVSTHLTDEQFSECAFSAPDAVTAAHLATCARCREELLSFEDSLNDFGRTTEAWSQAMPAVSLRPVVKRRERRNTVRVAWAFAAALAVAVGLPFATAHHQSGVRTPQVAQTTTQPDSAAQIAQDNQLMKNVYMALTPDDSSPLRAYGMETTKGTRSRSKMELRNQ